MLLCRVRAQHDLITSDNLIADLGGFGLQKETHRRRLRNFKFVYGLLDHLVTNGVSYFSVVVLGEGLQIVAALPLSKAIHGNYAVRG